MGGKSKLSRSPRWYNHIDYPRRSFGQTKEFAGTSVALVHNVVYADTVSVIRTHSLLFCFLISKANTVVNL
jgi:hypothetical protein